MNPEPTCRNCATTVNVMDSGLCTLCHLAVAGCPITGLTEPQALDLIRQIRADKRMARVTEAMEDAARNVTP